MVSDTLPPATDHRQLTSGNDPMSKRKTSRREFLRGKPVTEAMADRIEEVTGVPVVTIVYDGTTAPKNDVLVPYLTYPPESLMWQWLRHASPHAISRGFATLRGPNADQETEQSRMIDQLAGHNARGLARRAQHLTDDIKYDVRDGDEAHLASCANEYIAYGRVLEGKFAL